MALCWGTVLLLLSGPGRGAEPGHGADPGADLSPIVVTATRVAESSFDIPASVDRVDRAEIQRGQLQVNLSESLMTVPGVSAENRQNYAQDLQLSVRGFGARSSFGVRGVRLYSDGIPGTMPDGQGQFSQFDLGSAEHIEVLRGPFSALYGNSSGGVISIFTEDAPPGYFLGATAQYGSFNQQRYALKTMGDDGELNYVLDAAHFQTDGYRFHSSAERDNLNGKLRLRLSDSSTVTLVANVVETPFVQDPARSHPGRAGREPASSGHRRRAVRHAQSRSTRSRSARCTKTGSPQRIRCRAPFTPVIVRPRNFKPFRKPPRRASRSIPAA